MGVRDGSGESHSLSTQKRETLSRQLPLSEVQCRVIDRGGVVFLAHGDDVLGGDLLAACVSGVQFVPIGDLVFAALPAQQHPAALVGRGEVEEAAFEAADREADALGDNFLGDDALDVDD